MKINDAAMHMQEHGMSGSMMSYDGRLLLVGCAVNLVLAVYFAGRLVWRSRVPSHGSFGPVVDVGHLAMAAGMAYMFAPAGWQRVPAAALALCYVLIAVFFLVYNAIAVCEQVSRWHCCALLVIESLAMAYMIKVGSWGARDLTAGFRLLLAAVVAVAAARLLLRGRVPLPAGVSSTTLGSRLVMGSGMLAMLLLVTPL